MTVFPNTKNNFSTVLRARHTVGDNRLVLVDGAAGRLGEVLPSSPVWLTVVRADALVRGQVADPAYMTIFRSTAIENGALVVDAVLEGTADQAFFPGDYVAINDTAGMFQLVFGAINAIEGGIAAGVGTAIGSAVLGGTENRVLFTGPGPVMADSPNLTFADGGLTITGQAAGSNPVVIVMHSDATGDPFTIKDGDGNAIAGFGPHGTLKSTQAGTPGFPGQFTMWRFQPENNAHDYAPYSCHFDNSVVNGEATTAMLIGYNAGNDNEGPVAGEPQANLRIWGNVHETGSDYKTEIQFEYITEDGGAICIPFKAVGSRSSGGVDDTVGRMYTEIRHGYASGDYVLISQGNASPYVQFINGVSNFMSQVQILGDESNNLLQIGNTTTGRTLRLNMADSGGYLRTLGADPLHLGTNGGLASLVVGINGYVGVNSGETPSGQFQVTSSSPSTVAAIFKQSASPATNVIEVHDADDGILTRVGKNGHIFVGTSATPVGGSEVLCLYNASSEIGMQITAGTGGGMVLNGVQGGGFVVYSHTGAVGSEAYTLRASMDSAGQLAVGGGAPGARLHVQAGGAGTIGQIIDLVPSQSVPALRVQDSSANPLLVADAAGRLGIGCVPSFDVDVRGVSPIINISPYTGTFPAFYRLSNTGNASFFGIEQSTGGYLVAGSSAYATVFGSASAVNMLLVTGNAIRMTIDANGAISGTMDTMTYAATITLDVTKSNLHKVSLTGDATINASGAGVAGQTIDIWMDNDATPRTVTFGTNFKSQGTWTGTASKTMIITFASDGTTWVERGARGTPV